MLPLSMALHELATNTMTYRALSAPSKMMHVTWRAEERENEKRLLLDLWGRRRSNRGAAEARGLR